MEKFVLPNQDLIKVPKVIKSTKLDKEIIYIVCYYKFSNKKGTKTF